MSAPASMLPILLLAAGQSRRMRGKDKLAEEVDGQPLLRRQAMAARAATRGPVIVTLPPAPHPRTEQLAGLDVTRCPVAEAAEGMSASLRAGLSALPDDAPAAMILLADLPDLGQADLEDVLAAVDLESNRLVWRGATETGLPGHPLVIKACLFPALMALQGDSGGRDVLARNSDRTELVRLPGDRARRDLDTPEDWATWRAARAR